MTYSTKARVYDINTLDTTKIKNNVFVIDTNVLYWMHYSRCHIVDKIGNQTIIYPRFIKDLISNNNKVVTSSCNISELVNLIEKKEHEIYKNTNSSITKKHFRSLSSERIKVKSELESVLLQVKSIYDIQDLFFKSSEIESFVSEFENHKCDSIDFIVINHVINNGLINFVTDDLDYITIDNLNVYTANANAINLAKTDGNLSKL